VAAAVPVAVAAAVSVGPDADVATPPSADGEILAVIGPLLGWLDDVGAPQAAKSMAASQGINRRFTLTETD
jgi:hypothetical protein